MKMDRTFLLVLLVTLSGCVTARIEDAREQVTAIGDGESVVVMAKSYHQGNETEANYLTCVESALGRGSDKLQVIPHQLFVDNLFPWFEPRTLPTDTTGLGDLLQRPGVSEAIKNMNVRFIVWLDGDTERAAQGGSLSCAAGPGGGGCFGFAWWQDDAAYEAQVWDLSDGESAGTVSADFSGTSFLPALVVPIPLVARTQSRACKGLADQLKSFLVSSDTA